MWWVEKEVSGHMLPQSEKEDHAHAQQYVKPGSRPWNGRNHI